MIESFIATDHALDFFLDRVFLRYLISAVFCHCVVEIMAFPFILFHASIIASFDSEVNQPALLRVSNDTSPSSRILTGVHELFQNIQALYADNYSE